MKKMLFVDVETGGLDDNKHSLLSVGCVILDVNKQEIIDEVEYYIKQENYTVSPKALKVNKLNLIDVYENGLSLQEFNKKFSKFIKKHFQNNKKIKLSGHNVKFDYDFLEKYFQDFKKYFLHRVNDTSSILEFLYMKNILKDDISPSHKAFDYFNLLDEENRHSALNDAKATALLYIELMKLI